MIDFISLLQRISDKYGLKLASVDFTDVTLLARLEIGPHIYISETPEKVPCIRALDGFLANITAKGPI